MLRSEFDLLSKNTRRPTYDEYELIEFVYNWYPANFSKEAVASLYDEFGMMIFYDMEQRSKMAMDRDIDIKRYDDQIRRLSGFRDELVNDKLDGRIENNG